MTTLTRFRRETVVLSSALRPKVNDVEYGSALPLTEWTSVA